MRHTRQQYYTLFAQDEWHATPNLTLNYGLRYEYYTPLKVRGRPDRQVQHRDRPDRSEHHASCTARRRTASSRACRRPTRWASTVLRGGFGIFVGPGQGEDLIQPIESDRVNTTISTGPLLAYPINQDAAGQQLHEQPEQPQLPAARLRRRSTRFLKRSTSTPRRCSRNWAVASPRRSATSAARDATCSCAASPTRSSRSSPTRTRRARRSSSASSRSSRAMPTATSPACRTRTPRSTSRPAAATTATTR